MLIPTEYQQNILDNINYDDKKIIKIAALAGSGKTSTAKMLIEELEKQNPDLKWAVLVFNTCAKDDWRKWRKVGPHTFASFVQNSLPLNQWAWKHKTNRDDLSRLLGGTKYITDVKNIIELWEISTHKTITTEFVNTCFPQNIFNEQYIEHLRELAERLWNAMVDPYHKEFSLSDSGGMKLIYLGNEREKLMGYDVIIWDEAQDISDFHYAIMKKFSDTTHILFGDDYQTINTWKIGVNGIFNKLKQDYVLPTSFRFGPTIAHYANSLMLTMSDKGLKKYEISMKGNVEKQTLMVDYKDLSDIHIHNHKNILYLVRANKTIISTLLKYGSHIQKTHRIICKYTKGKKQSEEFLKGLKELIELKEYDKRFKYPSIWYKFSNWSDVCDYWSANNMTELQADIAGFIIENRNITYSTHIILQNIIYNNSLKENKKKPTFELCTVHSQKGAESDTVILSDDFMNNTFITQRRNMFEEHCIFNVAITRVKKVLYLPKTYLKIGIYSQSARKIVKLFRQYVSWKKAATLELRCHIPYELTDHILRLALKS